MSRRISSALYRKCSITSRKATFILSEVSEFASSFGHDGTDLNINWSTVHRARSNHLASTARNLKSEFAGSKARNLKSEFAVAVSLTIHWDGELLEDLSS